MGRIRKVLSAASVLATGGLGGPVFLELIYQGHACPRALTAGRLAPIGSREPTAVPVQPDVRTISGHSRRTDVNCVLTADRSLTSGRWSTWLGLILASQRRLTPLLIAHG
jgi:hypothetical protein